MRAKQSYWQLQKWRSHLEGKLLNFVAGSLSFVFFAVLPNPKLEARTLPQTYETVSEHYHADCRNVKS